MNRIDASDHYDDSTFRGQTPSLLTVVIDTNPRAWAALRGELPISRAIANLLVFINAHLAFGNDNQVAVLAAHTNRAVWLYPRKHHSHPSSSKDKHAKLGKYESLPDHENVSVPSSANKFPQFAQIEASILSSLSALIADTTQDQLEPTTLISGALTIALSHIRKTSLAYETPQQSGGGGGDAANPGAAAGGTGAGAAGAKGPSATEPAPTLHSRILVVSVSDSAPSQYIATMNAVFAASHARIPLDTLSLRGSPPIFLQQAAYITGGTFLSAADNPRGLLTHLMLGFLPDADARAALVAPTQDIVDFRAACFCHRRVVDTGLVCSICLSIFCDLSSLTTTSPPDGGSDPQQLSECLTCGSRLSLGRYGAKPAVVPRRKIKKKKSAAARQLNGGSGREDTASSATGTPAPAG